MSKKTLYFDKILNYTVTAATENGKLVTCDIERENAAVGVGNIYKGIIKSVLDGMQAAFVDCGLERNCYLPAEDLSPHCAEESGAKHLEFKVGDIVTVQVVKPPVGKKGAKVTTRLSFVGKSVIFLPQSDFVGVSNKITDSELRQNLLLEANNAKRNGEGVVVRAAAPFFTYDHISAELEYLRKNYSRMQENCSKVKKGLVWADCTLPLRILRDYNTDDICEIVVSGGDIWEKVVEIMPLMPDSSRIVTRLYAGTRDMLEVYGVADQIFDTLSPMVKLDGGANLVIQHTEALTVIDVNTGKFVGDDNYEQTVYQTNLAAAREIARQVRLRNIGGIVVVDFIDMKQEKHRKALTDELAKALQKDPAQCKVLPMSEFGLVEFTRRHSGKSLTDVLLSPCRRCGGNGYVLADEIILLKIRAEILHLLDGGAQHICVNADPETAENILASKQLIYDLQDKFPQAKVSVKKDGTLAKGGFTCKPCVNNTDKDGYVTMY